MEPVNARGGEVAGDLGAVCAGPFTCLSHTGPTGGHGPLMPLLRACAVCRWVSYSGCGHQWPRAVSWGAVSEVLCLCFRTLKGGMQPCFRVIEPCCLVAHWLHLVPTLCLLCSAGVKAGIDKSLLTKCSFVWH